MNKFTASVLAAAMIAVPTIATSGVACVETTLVDFLNKANACRTTQTCDATVDYAANVTASPYDLNNNYDDAATVSITMIVSVPATQQAVMDDLATAVGADGSGAMAALTWSSGLAAASASYTSEWKYDTSITGLTTNSGTTTSSRAAAQGTVTGVITETAYFINTYAIDPIDLMRLTISNDGADNKVAAALFDSTSAYAVIGASYAVADGCTMDYTVPTLCDMVFDIVVAHAFADASSVVTCTTEISYGGGLCDPTTEAAAVYAQINVMRQNAGLWAAYLDIAGASGTLLSNVSVMTADADFNGDETSTTTTFIRGTSNISSAKAAITTAGNTSALEWQGSMFQAAQGHATYLGTQTTLSTTGDGGSTFPQRIAEYGTAGTLSTEVLVGSSDTSTWVVLDMIIDDLDSTNASRTAILNASVSQAAVGYAASTTFGSVYVTILDNGFTTTDATPCEEVVVVVEPDTASSLAVAATATLAVALFM